VYNFLRKKYRADLVLEFIQRNYFIQEIGLYRALSRADDQPVNPEQASIIYKTVTQPGFNL
jgi:hypothetical protein